MTLIDTIAHEYPAWSPDDVRHKPLAKLLALYSAIAVRYDMKPKGPSYALQDILEAAHRAEEAEQSQRKTKRNKR